MVRISEALTIAKLMFRTMPKVAFDLNFPPEVAKQARAKSLRCVRRTAICGLALRTKSSLILHYTAPLFDTNNRGTCASRMWFIVKIDASKVLKLLPKIKELLLHFDARRAFAAFLQNIGKTAPRLLSRVKLLTPLVLRLWAEINREDVFKTHLIHAHWQRIIANCIFAVLLSNDILVEIRAICAAVGACQFGDFGHQLDVEVALLVVDRKKCSLSDRVIKARKTRKLEQRARQQKTMQNPMMLRVNSDALLVSGPVLQLRKQDFGPIVIEENQRQPRKRCRLTEGQQKPSRRVA
jgi:hypothetical protein